jgi:phosphatidate cytidylyltransferase
MKNLIQRTITGILFVGAIVGAIVLGKTVFDILFFIVTILSLWEFYTLANNGEKSSINKFTATLSGLFLYAAVPLWNISSKFTFSAIGFYILFCICLVINELYKKEENPIRNWAYFFLGQVYVVIPLTMLSLLNNSFDSVYLLALFVLIWTYDSGAYLFGVTFGKHKLWERISPKKSWEGAIGGLLVTCVAALIFAHFCPSLSIIEWIGFAIIVVVFGTFGDLTESLQKRTFNIKDSGNILPGHGGMLDRFDSLLFATPVVLLYLAVLLKNDILSQL